MRNKSSCPSRCTQNTIRSISDSSFILRPIFMFNNLPDGQFELYFYNVFPFVNTEAKIKDYIKDYNIFGDT